MSKVSRMFRTRSNRGDNLATRPVAELNVPTFVEADLSACLAALYNSSADALPNEFSVSIIPSAPFTRHRDSAPDGHALLTFTPKSTAQSSEPDEVLAVLLQTLDSPAPTQDISNTVVLEATFPDESAIVTASSSESRRTELFIVEKPAGPIRPPAQFLTEVMDLEAIAASARESATATPGDPSACQNEDPDACEAAKEQVVAEMNAVAEEFVAEQRHHAPASSAPSSHERPQDRRQKRRALISAPIRVRTVESESSGSQEIATTFDVSRSGILFHTQLDCYSRGMQVAVVFPYSKSPKAVHNEQKGRVVRVTDLGDGLRGVAITFVAAQSEASAAATAAAQAPEQSQTPAAQFGTAYTAPLSTKKPMVLAVDSDDQLRESLKMYLENEGYDVIAVSNAADAREVLNLFTPSLLVAEIEGEGNPGYDLCGHVKATPRLRRIPVVLTTFSAYPSDYSRAHSLGAIVCMAKPYKQERLGHIVRLLAPLPEHIEKTAAPRAADPTRVPGRDFAAHNSRDRKDSGSKSLFGKLLNKFPAFR
jgi:CheY-like chemotaxis protein